MQDWFPHEVPGWLSETEGRALARLTSGKTVLEIGSYCGRSTVCLAQAAKWVYCVDPFDGRDTPKPMSTLLEFERTIQRHGVQNRITMCIGSSAAVVPTIEQRFDLAFIDGAHDYLSVKTDILLAWKKLTPDGLFAFHDFRLYPNEFRGWDPGVTQAVSQLLWMGGSIVARYESLAIIQPPPEISEQ